MVYGFDLKSYANTCYSNYLDTSTLDLAMR